MRDPEDKVKRMRQDIIFIVSVLISFGCIMVYSSSAIFAFETTGDSLYFFKRQIIAIVSAYLIGFSVMSIKLDDLKANSKALFLMALILLALVLVPNVAKEIGGAKRWIRVAGIGFQPSELIKIALIIYMAELLSRKGQRINNLWTGLMVPAFAMCIMMLLVLLEPDLGRVIELTLIIGVLFFVGGLRLEYLMSAFFVSLPLFYFMIWRVPFRKARVLAFLNPWADPMGSGFQIIQSYLALGSGGIRGVGLGGSLQKLFYLPEAYTDFIFSIIGEETGFIGSFCVLLLFVLLVYKCFWVTGKIKDRFCFYVAFGITVMIAFEAMVNIGAISGAIPTKGLPLPFISYGGSALLANVVAISLFLNVSRTVEV